MWIFWWPAVCPKVKQISSTWRLIGDRYWDWSQDADPHNYNSTTIFESSIFDAQTGFGGNGDYVEPTAEQNPLNITGSTGGGCVKDGPFVPSKFMLNFPERDCLRRDFNPRIMNTFADPALVESVLAQEDYTSFTRAIENVPTFDQSNIHGSGHFGVGGVLGTIGNAANSPGGMSAQTPQLGDTNRSQIRCSSCIMRILITFSGSGNRRV